MTAQEKAGNSGKFVETVVGGERVRHFFPSVLPPDPPLRLDAMYRLLDEANQSLGRLDGISSSLPDMPLFLYMYVRKEAILSSQIEGTQSSLSDLLLFESKEVPGVPLDDVQEVSNYILAMDHGLKRLREDLPLSLRLIRDIHRILLSSDRGSTKQPGEFRRSQNWVGGSRPGNATYVPPPPNKVQDCMGDLEKFIYEEKSGLPVLVKAALIHVQFESIHPFLDGNGRLGRLLITFLLCTEGVLKEPILYLSLYFKTHRKQYYDLLQGVRETGDWEAWLEFFLTGVRETSNAGTETAKQILSLFDRDHHRLEQLGGAAASALRLHQYLQTKPILSVSAAAEDLSLSFPTVTKSARHLLDLGIIREVTGKKRNKRYVYSEYLNILSEGTEPL